MNRRVSRARNQALEKLRNCSIFGWVTERMSGAAIQTAIRLIPGLLRLVRAGLELLTDPLYITVLAPAPGDAALPGSACGQSAAP